MADIELVIKLPEKVINRILEYKEMPYADLVIEAIYHGTTLPKGHGRLIDVEILRSKFLEMGCYDNKPCYGATIIDRLKPIIEADKESEG